MNHKKIALSLGAFALFTLLALGATLFADASGAPRQDASLARLAAPTLGPTVSACPDKPAAPQLLSPVNGSTVQGRAVTLDWKSVRCAASYYVTVRKNTVFGAIVDTSSLYPSIYTTTKLVHGQTYMWHVSACNWRGCTGSVWSTFKFQ